MPRWLKALIAAFLALGLAVAVAQRPRPDKKPALPALPKNPVKLEIARPDAKLSFAKTAGGWRMTAPAEYPADEEAVRRALDGLARLSADTELTDRPDSYGRYLVDDSSGIVVSAAGEGGTARWIFGKEAPDFAHVYLRAPDRPGVYLAGGINRADLTGPAATWRDGRLFPAPAGARITRLLIEDGKTRYDLRRTTGAWSVNGATVAAADAEWFAERAETARANGFVDPPESADLKRFGLSGSSAAVFEAAFDSGAAFRCAFGKKENDRFPVRRNEEPVLLWFGDADWKTLLDGAAEVAKRIPRG